jgi:hypothetical protein
MKYCSLLLASLVLAPICLSAQTPNPAPRLATPADKISVLDGFKVELIRSAEPAEGSWVCMALDPKGRLLISPQ